MKVLTSSPCFLLKLKLYLLIIGLLILSVHSYSQGKCDNADIKQLINTYEQALNSGNVTEISKLFSNEAILLLQGSPTINGGDAIQKFYEDLFQKIDFNIFFKIEEINIINDEWALVRSSTRGELILFESQDIILTEGHEIFILKKRLGKDWFVYRYAGTSTK